jgi:aspartate racemase
MAMQHIGIVACSSEGAALCYRTICAEGTALIGRPHSHPEVTMHTPPFSAYTECLDRGDLQGVAALMLGSARKLAGAGADFLICPDNTIHEALPHVLPHSPLPWLHIAEVVAGEAAGRGFRRIGITGTHWLTASSVYPEKLEAAGLEWVKPDAEDRERLGRIIMDELVYGVFRPDSTAEIVAIVGRLREQGCDAVVLGCTELPLVVDEGNSPLPVLDSTRLLARAALRRAVGQDDRRG